MKTVLFSFAILSAAVPGLTAQQAVPAPSAKPASFTSRTVFAPSRPAGAGADWVERQIKTLTAPATVTPAVKALKLAEAWKVSEEDAVSRVQRMVEVEDVRGQEGMLVLKVYGASRQEVKDIAGELLKSYETTLKEAAQAGITARMDQMKSQKAAQEAAVEKARREMLEVMKKNGIVDFAPAPAAVPGAALSAEMEAIHTKAEPAQQEAFDQWLDHSLQLCQEDAAFRQTYISLLQETAELAALKASGLGERHPKIFSAQEALRSKRSLLRSLAASRRQRIAKELLDGVKAAEAQKSQAVPPDAAKEPQPGYAGAKNEYEMALQRLNNLRERAAHSEAAEQAPAVRILESTEEAAAGKE